MKNFKLHSLTCALAFTLMSCGAEVKTEQLANSSSKKQVGSTQSYTKPGAPIEMAYQILTQAPQAGDEIEIEVTFNSPIKSMISTKMNPTESLNFLNESKSWQTYANKSGEFESLPRLKLTAPSDGLYYVTLVASIEDGGVMQSRPFVIPVKVGNGEVKLKSTGEIIINENGETLIVHKAQTTKQK